MVSYRYLGSATTDANGIAKYNFTGSGAGEIDYIASLDNPIVDGSIVSETYTVIDGILKDVNGVGNIDYTNPTSATIDRTGGFTSITASTVGSVSYCNISTNHSSAYNFKSIGEFVVEFDLLEYTNDSLLEVNGHNGTSREYICSRNFAETGHYKYVFKATEQYLMFNGTKIALNTKTLANYTNYIYIAIDTKNNVKFNNFVIYPI